MKPAKMQSSNSLVRSLCALSLLSLAPMLSFDAFAVPPKKPTPKQAAKPAARPAAAQDPKPKASPAAEKREEKKDSKSGFQSALDGPATDGKAPPVFIRSDSMNLDAKSRVFTYYDNVEVLRGDLTITSDKVIGRYDDANQIEHILCEDNVVITRGDTLKASSNRANYDVKKGVIVLTEAPELNDRGNVLNADKVTIYVNEDRSEAEGQVRVKVLKSDGSGDLLKSAVALPKKSPTPAARPGQPAAATGETP
ncbi:MAG: hypothetical protein IT290_05330 [Deltaproteobacteria bacterium]|nr:hypothetical protein [Deltaproteobacteria bacterium]